MKRILKISLLFFIVTLESYSQSIAVKDTFRISFSNKYKISELNIVPGSEKIQLGSRILSKEKYSIDYISGAIRLSSSLEYRLLDTLIVSYNSIKVNLKKEYRKRLQEIRYDDKLMDTLRQSKLTSQPFTSESIFGKDLKKSGALIRGFTVGTNRDFTLNSGLRLQLSGKLSDDIDIVAALSDENTPIQPEGNTEKLDELDKVFIELKHKNALGTFGDYELNLRGSEFGQLSRKLQGLKGEVQFDNTHGLIAIAGSKGKFNSVQFLGQDGNQGPYRLQGINGERAIIVIAGSEKVFVDGIQLKRGENNDYVIDYSNAEVTFTPKKLITSASRISVDFEYTDQKYKRNFFAADFTTKLLSDNLNIGINYFREGDDESSPIDFSIEDAEEKILSAAGDVREKAAVTGVKLAEPDSLGGINGIYERVDTLINQQQFSYYKYSPGSIKALYNVSFTYTGFGNGDYTKESLGKYKFVGINYGDYKPIIYLPMPELKQMGNIFMNYKIGSSIKLSGELSTSSWDRNKFSTIDDSDNFGYARKILVEYNPGELNFAGISLGKLALNYKDRYIQSKYTSLDRIDEVEFSRHYNISNSIGDQSLREIELNYLPVPELKINSKYGSLSQGSDFSSDRYLAQVNLNIPQRTDINYNIDFVSTTNGAIKSNWLRQNGTGNFLIGKFSSGLEFAMENKEEMLANRDSLLSSSLQYYEYSPFVSYSTSSSFDIKLNVGYREESFPLYGELLKQSSAITKQLQLNYRGIREVSSSLNITLRDKYYTDEFAALGMTDNKTVLLLSQNRFNFWNNGITGDLYYQAASEQTARLEKVFVKVEKGNGNYIYLGDLNLNGIPEENEFQLTVYDGEFILVTIPTDKLFPVMDLKFNTRWKLDFKQFFKDDDFLSRMMKALSTETLWRVEENSKDPIPSNIYLLDLSKFLNEINTLRGAQIFQQDINLFQNSRELSFRFRYNQRKSVNQYSGGIERGYLRERSVRIYFKMIEEISNQTDIINKTDNLISPVSSGRARKIEENGVVSDFSYRPIRDFELGFKIESSKSIDTYNPVSATIDMNSMTLRMTYSFENFGRLRIEMERTELNSTSTEYTIPFEIMKGNMLGKNYFWRVFFDYRIASFVQTSVSYDARLQGGGRLINTMRAEVRAYF